MKAGTLPRRPTNPGGRTGQGRPLVTAPLLLALAIFAAVSCGGETASMTEPALQWGYGDGPGGPENWASLSAEYAACAAGKRQSPVDVAGYEDGNAGPLSFSYSGGAKSARNDGRTVQVEFGPGSSIDAGGSAYALKSAHFHAPSEHLIDGASFPAELHLVHENASGDFAVVGQLFEIGKASPIAQAILDAAPPTGETGAGPSLDAAGLAPEPGGYFRYAGSKTTPPCDEPVDWYVMRRTATISQAQVDGLLALSGGPNNRPVQPLGNRVITAANP